MAKTLTWSMVSFVLVCVSTWGSGLPAKSILASALMYVVIKSPVYLIHEKAWKWRAK
jgi:uncharacterized membrane protein